MIEIYHGRLKKKLKGDKIKNTVVINQTIKNSMISKDMGEYEKI